jgi:hypothetical protein
MDRYLNFENNQTTYGDGGDGYGDGGFGNGNGDGGFVNGTGNGTGN